MPMSENYRHKKRGTVYTLIGNAEVQTASRIQEGDELAIYRGKDGKLWCRPITEFHDGRFEPAPLPALSPEDQREYETR